MHKTVITIILLFSTLLPIRVATANDGLPAVTGTTTLPEVFQKLKERYNSITNLTLIESSKSIMDDGTLTTRTFVAGIRNNTGWSWLKKCLKTEINGQAFDTGMEYYDGTNLYFWVAEKTAWCPSATPPVQWQKGSFLHMITEHIYSKEIPSNTVFSGMNNYAGKLCYVFSEGELKYAIGTNTGFVCMETMAKHQYELETLIVNAPDFRFDTYIPFMTNRVSTAQVVDPRLLRMLKNLKRERNAQGK